MGRSVRDIEDILLSEGDGRSEIRGNGRASCAKRSEREQGREMAYKKVQVLTKISKKSGPLIMGIRGLDSSSPSLYYHSHSSSIYILII